MMQPDQPFDDRSARRRSAAGAAEVALEQLDHLDSGTTSSTRSPGPQRSRSSGVASCSADSDSGRRAEEKHEHSGLSEATSRNARQDMQRILCFAALIIGPLGAFPAYAEPILLFDVRIVQGQAFAVGPPDVDDFASLFEAAPAGAAWTGEHSAIAATETSGSRAFARQSSMAGPLHFAADSTVMASAEAGGIGGGFADASVESSYQIEFRLASPHTFTWMSIVESSAIGGEAFAATQFEGGGLRFLDTSTGSGLLPPGDYFVFGGALAGALSVGNRVSGTGRYRFDLKLMPAADPIPEPATLALVGGGLLFCAKRVRGVRRRQETGRG